MGFNLRRAIVVGSSKGHMELMCVCVCVCVFTPPLPWDRMFHAYDV